MCDPNISGDISHLGQAFDFTPCNVTFSIWSAIHAAKIGKQLRTLPSAQSISTPSSAVSCNGAKIRSNTPCRVSALTSLWKLFVEEDCGSLGGTSSSARRSTAIDPGLLCVVDGRFP